MGIYWRRFNENYFFYSKQQEATAFLQKKNTTLCSYVLYLESA